MWLGGNLCALINQAAHSERWSRIDLSENLVFFGESENTGTKPKVDKRFMAS